MDVQKSLSTFQKSHLWLEIISKIRLARVLTKTEVITGNRIKVLPSPWRDRLKKKKKAQRMKNLVLGSIGIIPKYWGDVGALCKSQWAARTHPGPVT